MGDPIDELGYVAVDMKDSVLRMRKMEVFGSNLEQPDLNARVCSDSLMRAAASYGANKGAYRIETEIPGLGTLLKGVGFLPEGKKFVCDLSKSVKIEDEFPKKLLSRLLEYIIMKTIVIIYLLR